MRGQELGEGIGFRQIVVATGLQPLDAVIDLAKRGEEQNGRAHTFFAQRLDDTEPVALRQHAVHDHDVDGAGERERKPFLTIRRMIDDVAAFAQTFHDIAAASRSSSITRMRIVSQNSR